MRVRANVTDMNPTDYERWLFGTFARPDRRSAEQIERERIEAHKRDPKHIKALAKRRKAKRGGPR